MITDILTAIGLIISILGLIIQLWDKFSLQKTLRDKILYLIYGLTIGMIVSLVSRDTILFSGSLSFGGILAFIVVIGLLIAFVLVSIKNTENKDGWIKLENCILPAIILFYIFLIVFRFNELNDPNTKTDNFKPHEVEIVPAQSEGLETEPVIKKDYNIK